MIQHPANETEVDAIVIGAGITGIYQVYLLKKLGLSVTGIEAGTDVGGTWYWNRYPGCRLDTESYAYGYFALKGIIPDWTWSERFAGQPELLRYARAAADRMDVRSNFRFSTKVTRASYDSTTNVWTVTLDGGGSLTCRYLISAVGPLSATRMPDIDGISSFEGEAYHSSRWPSGPDGGPKTVNFSGKRVGVIGTGATGVQIIPEVAKTADETYVYQRSPNWCTPLGNHPLSETQMTDIQSRYDTLLEYIKTTPTAFPYNWHPLKASEVSPEERARHFEALYSQPGYGIWLGGFRDLLVNIDSNQYLASFVAEKIRQRVKDPETAEKLIPKDHPFGAKRVPMETDYYETYNQKNVHLVDIKESPITRITPTGIETEAESYELDVIIYATGFNAVTGALDRIDIVGRDGTTLRDAWADGPVTYLGVQTRGFPNLFILVGPHNGAAFCNIGVCGGMQVEWVTRMIKYMNERELTCVEPSEAAQDAWTDEVYRAFQRTLLSASDAWWVRTVKKPDGSIKKRALIHVNGGAEYRKRCEEVAYHGYQGFELA